jgi:hypothetical protein
LGEAMTLAGSPVPPSEQHHLAPRSPGRTRSPARSGGAANRRNGFPAEATASPEPRAEFEDVAARAARLKVTPERVLREYARIAFADLRHIVDWNDQGMHVKEHLSEKDAAPIAEIVAASSGKGPYRVKLYDKKAALDAIARYLGMFPAAAAAHAEDQPADPAEDAREVLKRRLADLAARRNQEPSR